jgi:hypothetical protein
MIDIDTVEVRETDRQGKAGQRWAALTADNVDYVDDYVDVLARLFQEKYSYPQESAKEEVKRVFREFV